MLSGKKKYLNLELQRENMNTNGKNYFIAPGIETPEYTAIRKAIDYMGVEIQHQGYEKKDVFSRKRAMLLVGIRQIIAYMLYTYYKLNYSEIGDIFNLHRTNIYYLICRAKERIRFERGYNDKISEIISYATGRKG